MLRRSTSVNDHKNKLKEFNFNRFANIDLTNLGYIKLLHFILRSENPLTSYEIECGMGQSKYIHKMLDNLVTPYRSRENLFVWDRVGSDDNKANGNVKKKLYKILNSIYGLDWFNETDEEQYNYLILSNDGRIVTLSYGEKKKLEVQLIESKNEGQTDEKEGEAVLNIYDDKKRFPYLYTTNDNKKSYSGFLRTIRKKDGLHIYAEVYYNPRTMLRYLDIEYVNLKSKKLKIFSGNFRGFLFYLACELKYEWTQDSKQRIREVISNSSLIKKVPFLKYWRDFEDVGFDVLDILKKMITDFNTIINEHFSDYGHDYNTYEDDHSLIIGMNARDTSDDNIKLILIERFHKAVLDYFARFESPTTLPPIVSAKQSLIYENLKIESKLQDYNLEMLKIQRNLLSRRLHRIDEEINIGHPLYPLPFL